ncbi:hypothetical protein ACA29_19500 [Lederbergia galactosidilytica]|uniref:Uncharacterized protein n=1 Tax=Lederbergia galactosidilytica TaxID=217031 RepID=A0A0Q9XRM9_9BACI|nr:hypothetical protein ACA29_19500 [Lederbergia galactosidilytica]
MFLYVAIPKTFNKGRTIKAMNASVIKSIKAMNASVIKFNAAYNGNFYDVNLNIQKVPTAKIP